MHSKASAYFATVQASGVGAMAEGNQYVLSAPLVPSDPPGNSTLFICPMTSVPVPGRTKKLVLTGAPAFRVRVDANISAHGHTVLDLYVSAGISLADEVVDTWYDTPNKLPASTLRFDYGIAQSSAGASRASVSTFVAAVVPPGVYYVSSIGTFNATSMIEVIGTLTIEATPVAAAAAAGALSTAQTPAVAGPGSTAWNGICWNCTA